ncbi:unnamed protein product [Triticum turgidum subsp. durum]|uniref:Phosphoribosyltransferase domain-containing protein n=1 Tax=Triticum turgidum subsp. durum TaxID=4567 RepID=A0A9R0SFK0_TRITD|nr:unnamed protein product [Triticum turgidum subsp. durum]
MIAYMQFHGFGIYGRTTVWLLVVTNMHTTSSYRDNSLSISIIPFSSNNTVCWSYLHVHSLLLVVHMFVLMHFLMHAGSVYTGVDFSKSLCGISVIRSGESMENALRACCKGIKIGKILIHREGDDGKQLIYHNLPKDIAKRHVLLLDPILGTGLLIFHTYLSTAAHIFSRE